jgi:glycosyltransferase involved in cell wall biosynthesis
MKVGSKIRLLIITNKILHYRNDFFELLGSMLDLTVIHYGERVEAENYVIKKLDKKGFAKFYYLKGLKKNLESSRYDSIICIFDLRFLDLYSILFSSYSNKTLLWGIGISSSNGLRQKPLIDKIRISIVERFSGLILYSQYVANIYKSLGYKGDIYVANNSVPVHPVKNKNNRSNSLNFLFVGSIDKRKGIDLFLRAYSIFITKELDIDSEVNIIGYGAEVDTLKKLTEELNIENRVFFHGKINNPEVLSNFYSNSVMSFSINQAGLSVLQSIGHGVPFLSSEKAITGGELFNIESLKTGFLIQDSSYDIKIQNIIKVLYFVKANPLKLYSMRNNCLKYYEENASLEKMCKVFVEAAVRRK